jgi:hypothetical protein
MHTGRAFFFTVFLSAFLATGIVAPAFADETLIFPQATAPGQTAQICTYSALLKSVVAQLSDQEIKDALASTGTENGRYVLNQTFDAFCIQSQSLGGGVVRAGKLAATALTTLITAPIRFIAKFGVGIWTHTRTPERGDSYAELFGSTNTGVTQIIASTYEAYRVFLLAANPWLFAASMVTSIDTRAGVLCRNQNLKTPASQNFCNNYAAIKNGEFEFTEDGEKAGVWIGKRLLHTFDFRSDDVANARICEAGLEKQMRVAHRARDRLVDSLTDLKIADTDVEILPPEVNGCVTLVVQFKDQASLDTDGPKLHGIIDGLAYRLQVKKAQATPTPDPTNADAEPAEDLSPAGVCKTLYENAGIQLSIKGRRTKSQLVFYLEAVNDAHKFMRLNWEEVPVLPSSWTGVSTNTTPGRNYILILAPSPEQLEEYQSIKPEYDEINQQFQAESKKLSALKSVSSDYQQCLQLDETNGFDAKKFLDLKKSVESYATVARIREYQAMLTLAKKANHHFLSAHHTKLKWEIEELKNFNDLNTLLNDPQTENVLLVSHGFENGKIVDPYFNMLPANAFEGISSHLKSISFFACHSDQSILNYHLEIILENQKSSLPIRYLGRSEGLDFLKATNEAFVPTIPQFIQDLDEKLASAQTRDDLALATLKQLPLPASNQSDTPAVCYAKLKNAKITVGAMNLRLNTKWLGILYANKPEPDREYAFPCAWLNDTGKNAAALENAGVTVHGVVDQDEVTLEIQNTTHSILNEVETNKARTLPASTHTQVSGVFWNF